MSSLFHGRWKQYFQIPIAESIEHLSPSGYRYYSFLCRAMNVHSAVELRYSNAEIAKATGIKDHKTLAKARNELRAARLIECFKVPPGVYAHVMLDEAGNPIPAPKDRRGIRRYENDKTHDHGKPLTIDEVPATQATNTETPPIITRKCRTHGPAPHWMRGEDWICEVCHPNPWQAPNAKEIGF